MEAAAPCQQGDKRKIEYQNKAQWALSHFTTDATGTRKCTLCSTSYKKETSTSSLEYHLDKKHALTPPVQEKKAKFGNVATMFASQEKTDEVQAEKVVLAYAMNPTVSFNTVDNHYWKAAFGSSYPSGMKSSDQLKPQLTRFSSKLDSYVEEIIQNTMSSLQIDGGKSVSLAKLLAACIKFQDVCLLRELFDTELSELNGAFYADWLTKLITRLEELKCYIAAVTLDNEASPNAGVDLATANPRLQHVIHFRCGAHTLELVMESCAESAPILKRSIDKAREVAQKIRRNKQLLAALKNGQVANGVERPLNVFLSGNTRKWSSGYLMISRIVQLKAYVLLLQARPDWGLLPCDFVELEAVLPFLGHFYLLEQILQRDAAHALHLSYCWRRAKLLVEFLKRTLGDGEEESKTKREVDEGWVRRDALMRSSKVFDLFAALWPDPSSLSLREKSSAVTELVALVTRSWAAWQRLPDSLQLPREYRGPSIQLRDHFLLAARAQLNDHMSGNDPDILAVRSSFVAQSMQIEQDLFAGISFSYIYIYIYFSVQVLNCLGGRKNPRCCSPCSIAKLIGRFCMTSCQSFLWLCAWASPVVRQKQRLSALFRPKVSCITLCAID